MLSDLLVGRKAGMLPRTPTRISLIAASPLNRRRSVKGMRTIIAVSDVSRRLKRYQSLCGQLERTPAREHRECFPWNIAAHLASLPRAS
jgi:hypothetical protein